MEYILKITPSNKIAIITWVIDEAYPDQEDFLYPPRIVYVDYYNQKGELVHEDGVGGIAIDEAGDIKKQILEEAEYHFERLKKGKTP